MVLGIRGRVRWTSLSRRGDPAFSERCAEELTIMYRNVIGWYLQRITGALLVILLAAHFWVEHFMSAELQRGDLSYEAILGRIANPAWQFIDVAFLLVALYHGLNGLRNIILDYSRIGRRAAQALTVALVAVGLVWAWWGIDAFRNL